ncbi:hypothetical protein C1645_840186 [Glomus cerebriforme]|uniref:HMG box domain-containing protein n=1 Tax=Glomus cerebriforme TaxID=658196 RepID=A0A397SAB0_9GLOM|nr:hypothetical protein C1645_840186 [Glomus cerebriforme]
MNNNSSPNNSELVRPPYPPVITAQDLIPTNISSNKVETVRIPNAFIAYRMALVRQLKLQKVACHRSNISTLASRLWAEEPEDVKNTYRKMATDAQTLHNNIRGLTFLSYKQSTSQDEPLTLLNLPSLQQIQPSLQQNPMITSPIYFDNNIPTTNSTLFDQFNNNYNENGNFLRSKDMYEREQLVQVLEQQLALVACHQSNVSNQLWFEESEDNTYQKMTTDVQTLHNQVRGLPFFSYEQSAFTNNIMQDKIGSDVINPSSQEKLVALLNLPSLQQIQQVQPSLQQNPMITSPIYFDNNIPMTTSINNNYNSNENILGNKGVYERNLENRIQILEQKLALFLPINYQNGEQFN